jgi:hypothetical protein
MKMNFPLSQWNTLTAETYPPITVILVFSGYENLSNESRNNLLKRRQLSCTYAWVLSCVWGYAWWIIMVLDQMIDFLTLPCTISLNYKPYSAIADLHTFQFTTAQSLGFLFSTSRILAMDLNTETILQITMKSSCHFLFNHLGLLTPWILIYNDSILQFYLQSDLIS